MSSTLIAQAAARITPALWDSRLIVEDWPDASRAPMIRVRVAADLYQTAFTGDARDVIEAIDAPGVAAFRVYGGAPLLASAGSHEALAYRVQHGSGPVLTGTAGEVPRYVIPRPTWAVAESRPNVGAVQSRQIAFETLTIDGAAAATTRYPPEAACEVLYAGAAQSLRGAPLAWVQREPGVFVLPEPGFLTLTVRYTTRFRAVHVPYGLWPADAAVGQQITLARMAVLGGWEAPPVVVLLQREDAPWIGALRVVERRAPLVGWLTFANQAADAGLMDMTETSRQTVTERVFGRNGDFVDVQKATRLVFATAAGKSFTMTLAP